MVAGKPLFKMHSRKRTCYKKIPWAYLIFNPFLSKEKLATLVSDTSAIEEPPLIFWTNANTFSLKIF